MQSRAHAAIGAVVSTPLVLALWPAVDPPRAALLWTLGVVVSVLVDLDHFLVARLLVGDWRHLRSVLSRPTGAVWDQTWIFEDVSEDLALPRLLSHALLGGVVVAAAWPVSRSLSAFLAVVLYVHVLADLLRGADVA